MVEGIDGEREKEAAQSMAGMTYLRNQVYVGRRSIVAIRSRAGLPFAVLSAVVMSTVFVVGTTGKYPDARVPSECILHGFFRASNRYVSTKTFCSRSLNDK